MYLSQGWQKPGFYGYCPAQVGFMGKPGFYGQYPGFVGNMMLGNPERPFRKCIIYQLPRAFYWTSFNTLIELLYYMLTRGQFVYAGANSS